jgi:phosphoribosylanthranilate isomerase
VPVEIKFCGMTRPADAAAGAALGASYVGVIFAGGPRHLSVDRAASVLADLPHTVRRVGVFANQSAAEITDAATVLSLDVVQLHGAVDPDRVRKVREAFDGEVWPVLRVAEALPDDIESLFSLGDALLVDALAPGRLGGTGAAFAWESLAAPLAAARGGRRMILAGGLRPENVAAAVALFAPDVVDVSSGVESTPGIKDHHRMRAFRDAVAGAATANTR